jgi:hypothetical protein
MGIQVITTVITPAASYDLTDLPTVKAELNIPTADTTKDAYLQGKISIASSMIQEYCNRIFAVETVQDLFYPDRDFEPFWSLGSFNPLQLSRFPVASVSSIVIQVDPNLADNVTLTQGTDYVLNPIPGQVIGLSALTGFPRKFFSLPTTVEYVAGHATIPGGLVQATLELVTGAFYQRARDPFAKRTNQMGGVGEIEYWIPDGPKGAFPPSVLELIDRYRVPVIP